MEKIVRINKDGYLDVFSTDIKEFNSLFENDGCFVLDIPIMEDGNVFKYYSLDGTPDLVKEEAEQLNAINDTKKSEIGVRLSVIDLESLRPLRAIINGTQTIFDTNKLMALDAEAETLRAELLTLS